MKNKFKFILFALFLCFNGLVFSQEKNSLKTNEFYVMHYYTFEGNLNQDKITEMEQVLSKIEMVEQAKIKYKTEKNMGQIVLLVREKTLVNEGDKSFSPTSIKQVILKNGLAPGEYSTGKYEH